MSTSQTTQDRVSLLGDIVALAGLAQAVARKGLGNSASPFARQQVTADTPKGTRWGWQEAVQVALLSALERSEPFDDADDIQRYVVNRARALARRWDLEPHRYWSDTAQTSSADVASTSVARVEPIAAAAAVAAPVTVDVDGLRRQAAARLDPVDQASLRHIEAWLSHNPGERAGACRRGDRRVACGLTRHAYHQAAAALAEALAHLAY